MLLGLVRASAGPGAEADESVLALAVGATAVVASVGACKSSDSTERSTLQPAGTSGEWGEAVDDFCSSPSFV